MATNDKYDRQLRLWGANGQKCLMNSHILLIHANGVGSETLKNLVLPGIGNFTILDDYIVSHHDLSCNFFVTEEGLGKPRAEVVRNLLCEMNPDVNGFARVANFQNILQTEPNFFEKFTLIITANLPETHVLPLAQLCEEKLINLMILRSYGFVGSLRLQLPNHNIVEAKKDQAAFDLRVCDSFPELSEYCDNYPEFESLDSMEHAHIPFVIILFKALQRWKEQNQGSIPQSPVEKSDFQKLLASMSRNMNNEINFQEAKKDYFHAFRRSSPSSELRSLIEQQHDQILTEKDNASSFYLRALEIFLQENDNLVPLSGLLPDMTATTDRYVQLQSIFHEKAAKDRRHFKNILTQQLQRAGVADIDSFATDEDVETFCKNCQTIGLVQTSSYRDEVSSSPSQSGEVINDVLQNDLFDDPLQTPILWYLLLRAVDSFHLKYARWPGSNNELITHDQQEVFKELKRVAGTLNLPVELIGPNQVSDSSAMETDSPPSHLLTVAHAIEITRFGGMELHNISSVVGGIAAQEAVKIITHQYEPLNNTYIFNGIACCGAVYCL